MCAAKLKWQHAEGRKRQVCQKCNWINYLNPKPVVSCIVTNSKNELLLIKRGIPPHKGAWALPGGFQEVDESLEEAGKRELCEETGLKGKALGRIGVYMQNSTTYGQVIMIGIEYKMLTKRIKAGDDAIDAKFFPEDALPKIPFISQRKILKDYFSNNKK
jgi:8-oxo-dGTP diphosphatase